MLTQNHELGGRLYHPQAARAACLPCTAGSSGPEAAWAAAHRACRHAEEAARVAMWLLEKGRARELAIVKAALADSGFGLSVTCDLAEALVCMGHVEVVAASTYELVRWARTAWLHPPCRALHISLHMRLRMHALQCCRAGRCAAACIAIYRRMHAVHSWTPAQGGMAGCVSAFTACKRSESTSRSLVRWNPAWALQLPAEA